nr:MAG TPA: hypothetical protein [Caudoviricetes sp.]
MPNSTSHAIRVGAGDQGHGQHPDRAAQARAHGEHKQPQGKFGQTKGLFHGLLLLLRPADPRTISASGHSSAPSPPCSASSAHRTASASTISCSGTHTPRQAACSAKASAAASGARAAARHSTGQASAPIFFNRALFMAAS